MLNKPKQYPCVLVIAGSDCSGGAGIQADIKTIAATGGYAASAITALTAQNTLGVQSIYEVDANFVAAQIDSIVSDLSIHAIKIGMLHRVDIINVIAEKINLWQRIPVIIDPVMIAKGGHPLIDAAAISLLCKLLLPHAYLVTPNLPEAEILAQMKITSRAEMLIAAKKISQQFTCHVLLKGGHLNENICADVLYDRLQNQTIWFESPRIKTNNTHGTGCSFASAIASYLAQGQSLLSAVKAAKDYLSLAITLGSNFKLGHGHGPIFHFVNQPDITVNNNTR